MIVQVGKTYRSKSTGELFYIESMTTRPEGEEFNYKRRDGKTGVFAAFKPMSVRAIKDERWEEVDPPTTEHRISMSEKGLADFIIAYKSREKITMIKILREETGYGLKESKDIVDRIHEKVGHPKKPSMYSVFARYNDAMSTQSLRAPLSKRQTGTDRVERLTLNLSLVTKTT